jgi:hypothetical protein
MLDTMMTYNEKVEYTLKLYYSNLEREVTTELLSKL